MSLMCPALVVGVSVYPPRNLSVEGVQSDAMRMRVRLGALGYSVKSCITRFGMPLSTARLREAIQKFAQEVQLSPSNGGVLYFAGLGTQERRGGALPRAMPALCASDANSAGAIGLDELQQLLGAVASRVLIILDCGFAGARSYGPQNVVFTGQSELPTLSAARFFAGSAPSSKDGGLFTKALLEVLPPSRDAKTDALGLSVELVSNGVRQEITNEAEQGNDGVEIDGSTTGVYSVQNEVAVEQFLVALPPGPFFPANPPQDYEVGKEYWPANWPIEGENFNVRVFPVANATLPSSPEAYEWNPLPGQSTQYPKMIPGDRWTMKIRAGENQVLGTGMLCKGTNALYWFAPSNCIQNGRIVLGPVNGVERWLEFVWPGNVIVPAGLCWVKCDKLS